MRIPKTVCAYVAGFVDGEGYITIGYTNQANRQYHHVLVRVSNTVRDPLDLICRYFGGSVFFSKIANPRWKDIYTYSLISNKAKVLLEAIFPFLTVKKPQATLAMEFFDLPKYEGGYGRLSPETLTEREEVRARMLQLNKRGV